MDNSFYEQVKVEPLDLMNIFEVRQIRELIKKDRKLVEMFDEMITICNKKVNDAETNRVVGRNR